MPPNVPWRDRFPGLTHDDDETPELSNGTPSPANESQFVEEAKQEWEQLRSRERKGDLVNFRDIVTNEQDFHLPYPSNRSIGWRYVLETTEDWVKNDEEWLANIKKRQKEQQAAKGKKHHTTDGVEIEGDDDTGKDGDKHEDKHEDADFQKREGNSQKHNDAYAAADEQSGGDSKQKSEYGELLERYTPQEIALLRALQHEKEYRKTLGQNDGKRKSPQTHNRTTVSIDEQDQFSPDNWLPRSDKLIRLTGKHPLNAEAELTALYNGGLITPNELHYVRNHGAVPRIVGELHSLEVVGDGETLMLSMDELKDKFEAINIPVSLACDDNRRKELNLIKKSKGFGWGSGATGCAY